MIDEIKYIAYSIHQNTIMFSSLKEKDNSIEFEIKNISKSIVNAIRRTCLSNIPNTAFDEVNFKDNTTSLHDEFLKHRIELIPVLLERFDEKTIISNYTFKLHVTNKPNEPTYVTTNDIEVFEVIDGIEKKVVFKNMFIQKPNPILITRFPTIIDDKEIQKLNVEFKLRVGTGIIHTKYSPTTICVSIPLKDKNDETNNDTYKFKLESVGLVSPTEIVTKSFVSIGELLNTMQNDLSDNNIQINTVENFRGIEFVFEKQSATTGYMIQEMMYELFYNKEISHVSYHETHPLENTLAFRIKLIETDTDSYMESDDYINATKKLMTDSLDKLLESLSDIVKNWKDYMQKN